MKKVIILSIFIAIVGVGFWLPRKLVPNSAPQTQLAIGSAIFTIEVVDTPQTREQGLSGHKELKQSEGMLFVFPTKNIYGFWMKDMNFPLDFVWIADDRVVEIDTDVPVFDAAGRISTIQSSVPIDRVLEINAGVASKSSIRVGDLVQYSK